MPKRVRRKNRPLREWITAGAIALATLAGLSGMAFTPSWGALALALAAGGLGLAATEVGVLAAMLALSLPLAAADPILGLIFLVLGVVTVHYLGSDGARVFLTVAASIAGVFIGPAWAAAAIAGFVLGAGEGALAAVIAAALTQMLGLLLGRTSILFTVTGGSADTKLLTFGGDASAPNLFSTDWLIESVSGLGPQSLDGLARSFSGLTDGTALMVQPLLWAAAAVVAGTTVRAARRRRMPVLGVVGMAIAPLIPAAGAVALLPEDAGGAGALAAAAIVSSVLAVGFALTWDRLFPYEEVEMARKASDGSMAAEDADVDELLTLIATAEERLATEHTTNRVVMITDMKSFSRMTEEDGSVLTAKAIQKHRDLLLPLIEKHGGHGKSTGGDGLVAAFESAAGALKAAAEMQAALAAHNRSHPQDREMTVRIGLAAGEVVLDKRGRPFIGNALNLAARVMNLGDGGQAFVSADVVDAAPAAVRTHSLGDFDLKNIAKPVTVLEILWHEGQAPSDPRLQDRVAE